MIVSGSSFILTHFRVLTTESHPRPFLLVIGLLLDYREGGH